MIHPSDGRLYAALIGDLVSSRENPGRAGIQRDLDRVLEQVNDKYSSSIASRFTITLGDEFQGLMYPGAPILSVIHEIEEALHPQKIRFGIGIGEMTTAIHEDRALGADGPAYHRARDAVTWLKDNARRKESAKSDIRLSEEGIERVTSQLTNSLFTLMAAVKDSWTDRQREVIWTIMRSGGTQSQAAAELGITQPSVYKSLDRGNYYAYEAAFLALEKLLMNLEAFYV